jgi:Gas vesicle synthesis protein GvpL/GvpF
VSAVAEALYVYGVLPAKERDSVSVAGVEGSSVRTVTHNGLAALASPVKGAALSAAREVRAHWRVLQQASENATVVPVRFGTVLESEDAVRERLLIRNAHRLQLLLKQIAGCVQLTLKGEYREPEVIQEIVRSTPGLTALAAQIRARSAEAGYYDRIRLGERVAAEIERLRDDDTARAMDLLEPVAVAARAEEGGPNMAFKLAFLVRRARQDEFSQLVHALHEQTGDRIELRYVGPLPPYSFADTELDIGGSQWG